MKMMNNAVSTETLVDGIYLIATGRSSSRKIIISMPKHCFMVQLRRNARISIYYEGFSADEGRQLVEKYQTKSVSAFGRLLNQFSKEREWMGMSESGFYTLNDFTKCLAGLKYGIEPYAEVIYKSIWSKECGLKQIV